MLRKILAFFLLTTQISSGQHVLGLLDEANALLDQLRSTIQSEISGSHASLAQLETSSVLYGNGTFPASFSSLTAQTASISRQLSVYRTMVQYTHQDKSHCLQQEPELNALLSFAVYTLQGCIVDINGEVQRLITDAKYFIDVQYNKVNEIEFQLNQCGSENLVCIASVVSIINNNNLELVQVIHREIQETDELIDRLKLTYPGCKDVSLVSYAADSSRILNEIYRCITE